MAHEDPILTAGNLTLLNTYNFNAWLVGLCDNNDKMIIIDIKILSLSVWADQRSRQGDIIVINQFPRNL